MVTEDYKPTPRKKRKVSRDELLKTADYIASEWERERPGSTKNENPAILQKEVLRFMRRLKIQTIEDYEDAMTKTV